MLNLALNLYQGQFQHLRSSTVNSINRFLVMFKAYLKHHIEIPDQVRDDSYSCSGRARPCLITDTREGCHYIAFKRHE